MKKLWLYPLILIICLWAGFKLSLPFIAGASKYKPVTLEYQISPYAQSLIDRAFSGIKQPADHHVHLLGVDQSKKTYINPEFTSIFHPLKKARYDIFMHASKVESLETSLKDYSRRVIDQLSHMPNMKAHVFAFDAYHTTNGKSDLTKSDFFIDNDVVLALAKKHPTLIVPVASVHPYRQDAVQTLDSLAKQGVRFIKWLPNSMNIDPLSPQVDDFYQALIKHKMVLIVHGGEEHAVTSHQDGFGNPLLYRKVLDKGVKLIIAHAATMGECKDIEAPDEPMVPCFDLMERMLDDSRYQSNLYVDISSIYLSNHDISLVPRLLERTDWHHRYLYGSDYPLVAINVMVHLGKLVDANLLTEKEAKGLKEIYSYNPLLFGFVTTRTLRTNSDIQFAPVVFEARDKF